MSRSALAAFAVVVALHMIVVALMLRHVDVPHAPLADTVLDISLIVPPPPIPSAPQPPPHVVESVHRPTTVTVHAPATSPFVRETSPDPASPTVHLFNSDGTLQLPIEPEAAPQPFEADVAKGREIMGRGLSCEGPDALGGHDSLGEGVARKYLSWIGMYNPYKAQLRAAEAEQRLARCKHWKQMPPD